MSEYWKKRRWQNANEDGHHIDDWLMTYADMITLLLCFFAVFLAISVPSERKFEEAKKKVTAEFTGANSEHMKGTYSLPLTKLDTPPTSPDLYKALPSIVDRYNDNKNSNIEVDKRDRITTIEMNSAPFFARGTAILSDEGMKILADLAPNLKSAEYKDYTISVEGYTDDAPIKTPQFPSNWELSTARASAVVRALIDLGIPSTRLRAVGFAESVPKVPNRDANGKAIEENQAQNRRVVIRLEKIEKPKIPGTKP